MHAMLSVQVDGSINDHLAVYERPDGRLMHHCGLCTLALSNSTDPNPVPSYLHTTLRYLLVPSPSLDDYQHTLALAHHVNPVSVSGRTELPTLRRQRKIQGQRPSSRRRSEHIQHNLGERNPTVSGSGYAPMWL
jgi:hypothetical protein